MTNDNPSHPARWRLYGSIVLVVLMVTLYFALPPFQNFIDSAWEVLTSGDENRIEEWVSQFGAWGPLMIVLLMVFQMFLIVAPSWLLMVIAVLAYGPVWGGILSVAAVAVAAAVGYWLGKVVGQDGLYQMLGKKKEQSIRRETERYGAWAVVIARVNPLLSNDAVSFIAGMLGMGFRKFLLATMAGITPLAVVIAWFGEDWQSMKTGLLWLSVISLLGLVAKVWYDKRTARRR